jgi:hypothetical protein
VEPEGKRGRKLFSYLIEADFVLDPDHDPDHDPDLDHDHDPDHDPDLDPDHDPDHDPDLDHDHDPDHDPDPDHDKTRRLYRLRRSRTVTSPIQMIQSLPTARTTS